MKTHEQTALLHILGTVDGTLEPQPLTGAAWQADRQVINSYSESKAVCITNPGGDSTEKKRFTRAVENLLDSGMVFQSGRLIGLTPEGDQTARAAAGLPSLNDALPLLGAIIESKAKWTNQSVSESTLCGMVALPHAKIGTQRIPEKGANYLTAHILPLLSANLITWRTVDGFDGVYLYHPTPAGMQADYGDPGAWFKRIKRPKQFTPPEAYCVAWMKAYSARPHTPPARPSLIQHQDPVDPPRSFTLTGTD
jgi:hypothetical protein